MTRTFGISLRSTSTIMQHFMNDTMISHSLPSAVMSRSKKQVYLKAQYNLPRTDYNAKLIPNLMNKTKYVLDFRTLKFYLDHGMVLRKVHRGIKYHQRRWLAPYIAVNQEM